MSYDIRLVDKDTKEPLFTKTPHNINGTTMAMNGTNELWINITYNYRNWFIECFGEDGIHFIEGNYSINTWEKLLAGLFYLQAHYDITECSDDPWTPEAGDAYDIIVKILNLGFLAPNGVWEIT